MKSKYRLIILIGFLLLLTADFCFARVGGGHSYGGYSSGGSSGGYHGSSGHSGGGDIELIFWLLYLLLKLCIEMPVVGIPLTLGLIIGGFLYFKQYSDQVMKDPTAAFRNDNYARRNRDLLKQQQNGPISRPATGTQRYMEALKRADSNFSVPLFNDFINLLYSRFQTERVGDMSGLTCYIAPDLKDRIIKETKQNKITQVKDIIVGSIRIDKFVVGNGLQKLVLALETNYTEISQYGERPVFSQENWILARKDKVLSQPPESITKFACPSCGSPQELKPDHTCSFCGKTILDGSWAWILVNVNVISRKNKPKIVLSGGSLEMGTTYDTVVDPQLASKRKAFSIRHPEFVWQEFEERTKTTFESLQKAWSTNQWELARPYETDNLFAQHTYWVEAYRSQGLINKVEDVTVKHIVPVKFDTDAFYDMITVRIWAYCLDWVEQERTGKVVQGSKTKPRGFTEYWTFIRRSNFHDDGAHKDPKNCPNCGAQLNVGMSGVCPYCDSKVNSGDFDWTLSLIEQDEAYTG